MVGINSMANTNSDVAVREQAAREGYGFIGIRLLNPLYDGALGAEVLQATSRLDYTTNAVVHCFSVTGGQLRFEPSAEMSGRIHQLVDTEHNRKVLKGLVEAGAVEIVDKAVEAELGFAGLEESDSRIKKTKDESPKLSRKEYFAELNKSRGAAGLSPVGGDTVDGTGEVDAEPPPSGPTPPPAPTLPPLAKGKRPASRPPSSPLVSVEED